MYCIIKQEIHKKRFFIREKKDRLSLIFEVNFEKTKINYLSSNKMTQINFLL